MTERKDVPFTLEALQSAFKSGELTCESYIDAVIERAESLTHLNAFITVDWELLRKPARDVDQRGNAGDGLNGIPLCFKDNIPTGVLPASAATKALAGNVGGASLVAERLLNNGALVGGMGNMHELAFGITTNNAYSGAAKNPWNTTRIPGGSSGGVAVAIAAGIMPAGIGTDTGGSVRLPSALCGIVGFRPSINRYPSEGLVPVSHTRDTTGPMANTVKDCRILDAVMAGKEEAAINEVASLSSIKLGVPRGYFFENLDPEVARLTEEALQKLSDAGVTLVEADIPNVGELNEACSFPIALYEFMQDLPAFLATYVPHISIQDVADNALSPDVSGLMASLLTDGAMPESVYREAIDVVRPKLQRAYADYFSNQGVDAVIFPTTVLPAAPIGDDETVDLNGERLPTFPTFIHNTDPGSNAGIPGISLPIGLTRDGLPVGIEIDGPFNSDERLLAIADALESVFNFTQRP
ncbi:indoleacetamide hydrolase [Enterovibrio sp. ZSDZ35]|uniref:Indoleacetamide hydrolase n=1 Tax=Enterovibrio qingdaonensis TaxID=2899818 RepID=A0ABT5QHI3_9GAMM|nr:indoleacetamide hydrolase [Enterovibrio sp. ZSDZ35]MDD1780440.1 indoleacetamide hydrolase [Enterovibrio sp. ZSDZ35]